MRVVSYCMKLSDFIKRNILRGFVDGHLNTLCGHVVAFIDNCGQCFTVYRIPAF